MKRKQIVGISVAVLGFVGAYWAVQSLKQEAPPLTQSGASAEEVIAGIYAYAEQQSQNSAVDGGSGQVSAEELYQLALKDLPSSLRGTAIDGGFRLDSKGRLIVEPDVVRVFEYFMTTIGEDDLETIVKRVRTLIEAALPDSAKADAHLLLAQYLDYRQRQADIMDMAGAQGGSNVAELRETFQAVRQMRREVFGGQDADALFADEESYLDFNLNTMEASQATPNMTELDRLAQIKELSINLPEHHRKVVEEQLVQRELTERTRILKEQNASAEELRQMREQLIGTEAAERLAVLDDQRAAWDGRVSSFDKDYKDSLSALGDQASDADKQQLLDNLLSQHGFSATEQKRVKGILGLY